MRTRLIALAAMAIASVSTAHASIFFDAISGQSTYYYSGITADGSNYAGQSFTAIPGPDFDTITVALFTSDTNSQGSVLVYLFGDDGSGGANGVAGNPDFNDGNGAQIGTISDSILNSDLGSTPSYITLTAVSSALPLPTQNNEYWLLLDFVDGNSAAEWSYNQSNSGIGTANQEGWSDAWGGTFPSGKAYDNFGSTFPGSYELTVTPEPASLALLGAAFVGLGYMRRRSGTKSR